MIEETSTKTFIEEKKVFTILNRFVKDRTIYLSDTHELIKAYDKLLDKDCVLKIIKNSKNEELLFKEFKILIKLNHLAVIRGYEIYTTDDYSFYTMEYIEGNFELKYFGKYIESILDLFNYLHKKSIIHNDIKPNNFIFRKQKVKLIDFSKSYIAKTYTDLQKENIKLSRFLIHWINYNLNTDVLGNTEKAEKFINKNILRTIIKTFYGNNNAI